jgi:broad specificity phosphatase PhoE
MLNREMRYIGRRDDTLTETGRLQACHLAETLANLPIAAIYSSPLQRAYQTAQTIAEHHELEVARNDALSENDFGQWEGLTAREVKARGTKDAAIQQAWQDDPSLAPPQGESLETMSKRVLEAVGVIVQEHSGQTVALVTHTGPIKAILCAALNVPMLTAFHIFLDPGKMSIVDWQTTWRVVRLVNSTCVSDLSRNG